MSSESYEEFEVPSAWTTPGMDAEAAKEDVAAADPFDLGDLDDLMDDLTPSEPSAPTAQSGDLGTCARSLVLLLLVWRHVVQTQWDAGRRVSLLRLV